MLSKLLQSTTQRIPFRIHIGPARHCMSGPRLQLEAPARTPCRTLQPLKVQSITRSFSQRSTAHLADAPLLVANAKSTIKRAFTLTGTFALGLGLASLSRPTAYCDDNILFTDSSSPAGKVPDPSPGLPPPPKSSLNAYELSFGTVCGVCAGVFVKKGIKTVAFILGGVFVILQYFGSLSLLRVNWTRFQSTFENTFYRTNSDGVKQAPTISSFFTWFVDFLTADFPPRATFLAGFILGLRLG